MNELEKIPLELESAKKKITKTFMNNLGFFMGAFLIFAVIVIMTTDIRIVSLADITSLGLDFFLLLFCSYSMYVCCADSGTKAGLSTTIYTETMEKYEVMKKSILESQMQTRMSEFCNHYIADELKNTKMAVLAPVGFSYEEYLEKYSLLDNPAVDAMTCLSASQKKAVKKANKVKPVRLSPEMILRKDRNSHTRSPLDRNPSMKKSITFGTEFIRIGILSVFMSMIALDVIVEPSWIIFASVCLKLVSVIVNGFGGYSTGYDNIVVDTVNYVNGQIDLMQQAIQYIEAHPTTND